MNVRPTYLRTTSTTLKISLGLAMDLSSVASGHLLGYIPPKKVQVAVWIIAPRVQG